MKKIFVLISLLLILGSCENNSHRMCTPSWEVIFLHEDSTKLICVPIESKNTPFIIDLEKNDTIQINESTGLPRE